MEMEFKDTGRRRRFILLTTGIALAVVAGWTAFTFASRGTAPAEEVVTRPVLVAARDVAARTTLTADDLTVRQVPVDEALTQAYEEADVAIGRVSAVPIYADQQITPNLFATSAANADFSILGPDDVVTPTSAHWRAVALDIPAGRAVGGEIKPSQRVDLFVSVQIDIFALDEEGKYQPVQNADGQGLRSGRSTKIVMQDLEVLKSDPGAGLYILKVDLHQAEQIYHIVQLAPDSFSLALRPDEDSRIAYPGDYGTTTDSLVMEYYFPVPQLIDLTQLLSGAQPTPAPAATPSGDEPAASPAPEPPDQQASPEPSPAP
jgi:Flp pilus assembly protein CpaB